MIQEYCMLPSG